MMPKNKLSIYLLLFALAFTVPCFGYNEGLFSAQIPKYEVRAVWLTTLGGLDWPRQRAGNRTLEQQQKKELTDILDKLKAANINTVLFQTRIRGTVIYPSAIEPWDECITGTYGKRPEYDPLAFAIEECHKRGMEIQAWVVAIPTGRWNSFGCGALRRKHPGLIVKKGNEGFIDPANPRAATYIANICKEITDKYDVDGIHLDYIRYPEVWDGGRSQRRNHRTQGRSHADAVKLEQQIRNITSIVRSVHNAVKGTKPWVKLSCATIGKYSDLKRSYSNGWNALVKGRQDAQEWLRLGIVDQLYPMMYFRGNNFYPFAFDWKENSHGRTVVPGLGIYFMSDGQGRWPLSEIERQMNVARANGMGYAMFRAKHLIDNTKGIYVFTKETFNTYPALIPPTIQDSIRIPEPPTNLQAKRTGDYISVNWNTPANDYNTDGGLAFNIYASDKQPVDINDARNLLKTYEKENFLTVKTDKQLHFAITSIDRYGNESEPLYDEEAERRKGKSGSYTPYNMLSNNGLWLSLPPKGHSLDADYIVIKSLAGVIIATRPYNGEKANIGGIAQGCYSIYSLNGKGVAHRLGFTIIKR